MQYLPSRLSNEAPICARAKTSGFALLITITLLAFLVLLLVSLASLTRVETQVAGNSQQQAQARQNALMALNIAIGQLQKYAGPDQRVTARSDMDSSLATTLAADASAPTPTVKVSGRWVGAYGSGAAADYSQSPTVITTNVVAASDARGSQAKLLNWLVSGNENTAFNPATDVGTSGNITNPPSSFQFAPSGVVSGLTTTGTALTASPKITDSANIAQPASLLVGPNTAGNSVADYVAAPLREISAVVPGLGATAVPVGRYAWWVGDEGAKARINLPVADATEAPNAFASSQRAATELVDATHPFNTTTLLAADMLDPANTAARYDPKDTNLPQVVSADQLPLLPTASTSALRTALQYRYHDLTARSASVLADSYAGGLKKDLSALLATGSASPADTEFIFPPQPNDATYKFNHVGVPTWGQLRSFAQTSSKPAGLLPQIPTMAMSSNLALYGTAPVATNVGISPVMTYAAAGFRYIAPEGDVVGQRIRMAMVPIIVLWNPYTVPMRGTDDSGNPVRYEVGIRKQYGAKMQLQGRAASTGAIGTYTWGTADVIETVSLTRTTANPFYRFEVEIPAAGIPAGESLVFTLKQNGQDYSETNNILSNGLNDDYYVLLPGAGTITPALGAGAYYRVAVNASPTAPTPASRTIGGVVTPQTMWGLTAGETGVDGNYGGGGGWAEAYVGKVSTAPNFPTGTATGTYPWTATFGGQNLYQLFSTFGLAAPTNGTAPYGPGAGYAVSAGPSGLVQPEATLGTNMTAYPPTFRILLRALFANPIASGSSNSPTNRTRWMLQGNIRALLMTEGGPSYTGQPSQNGWPCDLSSPDDLHVASGTSLLSPLNTTTLYEFRPDSMPLLSIGQLQHANLGWVANAPSYAIGNSNGYGFIHYDYAINGAGIVITNGVTVPPAVHPERLVRLYPMLATDAPGNKITAYYDHSWLLNRALWDRYFVSTVPQPGTGKNAAPADTAATTVPDKLANPLHVRYNALDEADLKNADKAAAHLLLTGGFNINSTSEQAWRVILGGANQLNYDPTGANTGGAAWKKSVFPRFSKPTTNSTTSPWLGYKQLNEVQIAQFAKSIVAEIRNRGPFISLADFINRRLYTGNGTTIQPADTRLKGAVQAAIDSITTGAGAINSIDAGSPLNVLGSTTPSYKVIQSLNAASIDAFAIGSATPGAPIPPYGTSGAGSPQFLTQADVFSAIGSHLTARSDTFVIRTCGEVLDPVNSTSATPVVTGRAWCEATVQRLPEYVEGSLTAETDLQTAPASTAKTTNQNFGRKFKIISFRWLTPNDI
jgi:Tfp pilus assembly protein PilX